MSPIPSTSEDAYRAAGVDLQSARTVVDIARRLAAPTHRSDLNCGAIGGFSGAFTLPVGYRQPVLLAACDGVGTKLELARQLGRYDTIGVDLVAMSVNDLLVQGGEPLVFLDYVATSRLDPEAFAQVLEGIAEGCQQAGCALIGGETAEMPGLYQPGQLDLAGFALGVVERDSLLPRWEALSEGTVLLGLPSSGLHSNGFSLVRKLLTDHAVALTETLPGQSVSLADELLRPTQIYVQPVRQALAQFPGAIQAMAHITGGGFPDNVERLVPERLQAVIDPTAWRWPPVFAWLQQLGQLSTATLLHTFNCGIGLVLAVQADQADALTEWFRQTQAPQFTPVPVGWLRTRPAGEQVAAVEVQLL